MSGGRCWLERGGMYRGRRRVGLTAEGCQCAPDNGFLFTGVGPTNASRRTGRSTNTRTTMGAVDTVGRKRLSSSSSTPECIMNSCCNSSEGHSVYLATASSMPSTIVDITVHFSQRKRIAYALSLYLLVRNSFTHSIFHIYSVMLTNICWTCLDELRIKQMNS